MPLTEAELVTSVLTAGGIAAEIPDELAVCVQSIYGTMEEVVRALLHASDLDRDVAHARSARLMCGAAPVRELTGN